MTNDPKDSKTSLTSVDLGEDLIAAKTKTMRTPGADRASETFSPVPEHAPGAHARVTAAQAGDQYQNAEILFREGMLEEAKKKLRSILVADPRHAPSRKLLQELHAHELRQIFASDEPVRPARVVRGKLGAADDADADDVLRQLEEDLDIGEKGEKPVGFSLFAEFCSEPEEGGVLARDRADLGIAFMEMGLYDEASGQFELACRRVMLGAERLNDDDGAEGRGLRAERVNNDDDPALTCERSALIEYTSLLARAQIDAGRPLDATTSLEPILRDTDVPHASKLELLYQMGRAFEELGQAERAIPWFKQAEALEPDYRDLRDRLRRKTRS